MHSSQIKNCKVPSFLLNAPFSLTALQANNQFMLDLADAERGVDFAAALDEWLELYHFLGERGLVYVLPSQEGLQDLPYVSNLAIVLPHLKDEVAVIANFQTEPRRGETAVGQSFFRSMGFETIVAPKYFEGEADLKYLRDNIYFGAHGMRTSLDTLDWFRDNFDMQVIPIKIRNPYMYHLDCVLFPLSKETVIVCTEVCEKEEIRAIEQVAEIIDIEHDIGQLAFTNLVRCQDYILGDTFIKDFTPGDEWYDLEKKKQAKIESICAAQGLELKQFYLGEFYKSGAALSCLVLPLNYPRRRNYIGIEEKQA